MSDVRRRSGRANQARLGLGAILVGSVALVACGTPQSSPTSSTPIAADASLVPPPSASPQTQTVPTAPGDAADAFLMALVPEDVRDRCAPTALEDLGDDADGTLAFVSCDFGAGQPDSLYLQLFDSRTAMDADFVRQFDDRELLGTTCAGGAYQGTYLVADAPIGHIACFAESLGSWLVWTIDDLTVSGAITGRSEDLGDGTYAGDTALLHEWFLEMRPFGPRSGQVTEAGH